MIKGVLIFLGGALSGAALSYFYLNKRYTDKLNKEIEDLRGSYDSIFEEQRKRIKEAESELNKGVTSTDVVNHVIDIQEEKKVNYASYSKDGVKFNPETFHDKSSIKEPEPRDLETLHPVDSDEDDEEEEEYSELTDEEANYIAVNELNMQHELNRGDKPKLIKYEDYGEDHTLETATLLYYVDNDILTTEDEEEIPDPRMLVGNCLDKFGFRDSDENSIFVRNSRLGFDYEIVKVYDSYSPRGD